MSVPSNSELIPIWHFRWVSRDAVERWNAGGSATMTPDKLAELVREAQRIGFEAGEQQGRYNLRKDIESGEVEPIKANPNNTSGPIDLAQVPEDRGAERVWRSRAVKHASALMSILSADPAMSGTFGELWLREAKATIEEADNG